MSERAGERAERKIRKVAERQPYQGNVELDQQLAPDMLERAIVQVKLHLNRGHWEQAKATIDSLARECQLAKNEAAKSVVAITPDKLAMHVTWLAIDNRTVNLIEAVCAGTVGALLDAFPAAFVGRSGVGPHAIHKIAKALILAGVLDRQEASVRIGEWNYRSNHKPSYLSR